MRKARAAISLANDIYKEVTPDIYHPQHRLYVSDLGGLQFTPKHKPKGRKARQRRICQYLELACHNMRKMVNPSLRHVRKVCINFKTNFYTLSRLRIFTRTFIRALSEITSQTVVSSVTKYRNFTPVLSALSDDLRGEAGRPPHSENESSPYGESVTESRLINDYPGLRRFVLKRVRERGLIQTNQQVLDLEEVQEVL